MKQFLQFLRYLCTGKPRTHADPNFYDVFYAAQYSAEDIERKLKKAKAYLGNKYILAPANHVQRKGA